MRPKFRGSSNASKRCRTDHLCSGILTKTTRKQSSDITIQHSIPSHISDFVHPTSSTHPILHLTTLTTAIMVSPPPISFPQLMHILLLRNPKLPLTHLNSPPSNPSAASSPSSTASLSSVSSPRLKPRRVSSSRTAPSRSSTRLRCWLWDLALWIRRARGLCRVCSPVTRC